MDSNNLEKLDMMLNQAKCSEQLKDNIDVVMEKNIGLDRADDADKAITSATLFAYARTCNVEFERANGRNLSDHASILLKGKVVDLCKQLFT